MNTELLLGLLFTMLPITELRVGLPIVIDYVSKNNLSVLPYFLLVILCNILVIFFIFGFMNFFHKYFLKFKLYNNFFSNKISKLQDKSVKLQTKINNWGYFGLVVFVAIPLPGTGAWTGSLLAWLLKLDQKKSIFSISLGVFIAGLIILIPSLGIFGLIY
jgi:uncharacterized membrane protein